MRQDFIDNSEAEEDTTCSLQECWCCDTKKCVGEITLMYGINVIAGGRVTGLNAYFTLHDFKPDFPLADKLWNSVKTRSSFSQAITNCCVRLFNNMITTAPTRFLVAKYVELEIN